MDFCNTILIMTSNIGAREIKKGGGIGFSSVTDDIDYDTMRHRIMDEVKRLFNPEFINRIDEIVVFRSLSKEHMLEIVDIVVDEMLHKVEDLDIEIELTKGAKEFIVEKGFDPVYGARPLRRTIQKYIEDPIAEELLKGTFGEGSHVQVKKKGDGLDFVEVARKKRKNASNKSRQKPKREEIEG